jgi:hypothetical protein
MLQLFEIAAPGFRRSLRVLAGLLDKAEAHFEAQGRDPNELADLRLAPDMKPFAFQIEAAIDNALGAAARLRGVPPPPRREGLITLAHMRRAVSEALAQLDSLDPSDFEGAETREVVLPSPKGDRHFDGLGYVLMLALPNVQFHTGIAYALLRAEGVDIGKRDFLGELPARRPPASSAA